MLGIEPGPSGRTASALNCWTSQLSTFHLPPRCWVLASCSSLFLPLGAGLSSFLTHVFHQCAPITVPLALNRSNHSSWVKFFQLAQWLTSFLFHYQLLQGEENKFNLKSNKRNWIRRNTVLLDRVEHRGSQIIVVAEIILFPQETIFAPFRATSSQLGTHSLA